MDYYKIEPDYSLRGFNRFTSTDHRFPLSLSYPEALNVQYDQFNEQSLFVNFGTYPWDISVTRWDFTRERYNFAQGGDLNQLIKKEMNEFRYGAPGEPALAINFQVSGSRFTYEAPNHRHGERVYIRRPADSPSIIWTFWRNADANITENTFNIVMRSVRWL